MKVEMEFKGLEELVKAFEESASDEEIKEVNRTIAEKAEPVVQRIMSGKMPKSADISKSGRGFVNVSQCRHMQRMKYRWEKSKQKERERQQMSGGKRTHKTRAVTFYVRFINWGTIYRPPQEFIFATGREADGELQKIAEQEYQSFLDNTVG